MRNITMRDNIIVYRARARRILPIGSPTRLIPILVAAPQLPRAKAPA